MSDEYALPPKMYNKMQQLVRKQNPKIYFELQTWYGLESKVLKYVCTVHYWRMVRSLLRP